MIKNIKSLHILGIVIAVILTGYLYLVNVVMPKYITEIIPIAEKMAPEYINGTVKIGSLKWNGGLTAEIKDIVVKDMAGKDVAVLPKTEVVVRPWLALIKPERAISKVNVVEPKVWLRLEEENKWNIASLMKPSESTETPFYGILEIEKGKLHIATTQGEWELGTTASVDGGANPKFAINGDIITDEQKVSVRGLMTTKGVGKLQINTDKLSFSKYSSLIKHYTSVEGFAGDLLKTHVILENDGKNRFVSGETEISGLGGSINVNEDEGHNFAINSKLKIHNSILDIESLEAIIDREQKIYLNAKADLQDFDNIGAQGLLTAPQLAYKNYSVKDLRLPFTLSRNLLQIDKASVLYGGGEVRVSATNDLRENSLTADISLNNVSHKMSIKHGDEIHANGELAVVGRLEENNDRKSYQIHVGADTFDLSWKDLKINKMALDGDFDGKNLVIDHFSAQTGEGVITLKGNAIMADNGKIDLVGRMSDFAIDPILYHFGDIQGKGLLSMNFEVGGTVSSPEFGTMVQLRKVDVQNLKMAEMHGFVGMQNNVLTINNLGATLKQGRHIINGMIDFKQSEPQLALDVVSNKVRIEPLMSLVSKDFSLTGNLDNKMHVSGTPAHPKVQGELAMSDGSVQTYLLKGVKGKYVYDDGFISLQDFIVSLFVAEVEFSGTVSKKQQLNFDLSAKNVDISKSPYKDADFGFDGLMDINGHVKGSVQQPFFDGNVNASKIFVNGELYTDISGKVESDLKTNNSFDISFKQPHRTAKGEAKKGTGTFKANGNLNMVEKFLQGNVIVDNGDINGLLRTDKLDYALGGVINGKLAFAPHGKGSGVLFDLTSNSIDIHKLHYESFVTKGVLKNFVLTLENAMLQEKSKISDAGILKAFGNVDFKKKLLDINASAIKANPQIVNITLKEPLDVKGTMNLDSVLKGTFDNPKGEALLELVYGSFRGVEFDNAKIDVSLDNDIINIKELLGTKGEYSVMAKGLVPMDAVRAKNERKNPDAEMDLAIDFDNTRLGILTASEYVDWANGELKGKVNLRGTLENPLISGSLSVDDGSLKIKGLNNPFENINFSADFDGSKVQLNSASAKLGEKGKIDITGYYDFRATDEESYKLNIKATDAFISYAKMFKGVINSEIEILPQFYYDYWHTLSKYGANSKPPRLVRPLIKGNIRFDDVLLNILTVADSEVGAETNIGLDLGIELGPKIHMLNPMFYDILLSGGLNLKGGYYSQTTGNEAEDEVIVKRHNRGPDGLKIGGKIAAEKGNITYLRTPFKITEAELRWPDSGEILPHVKLDSWSRFGKYRVFLKLDGSLADVKNEEMLKLSSNPPMERNTLVRMLTLQRESAGNNDINNDDLNNLMSTGLQMAVLGNMEFWVKQNLGLDQFRVYTGKVNTGLSFDGSSSKKELTEEEKNRYNVLISKYITDKFMLGYTTSVNNEEKVIFGQYDIGRNFNISISEKDKKSGERDHWVGLEYRIDFK